MIDGAAHSRRAQAALSEMPGIDPAIAALALWCIHRDGSGPTRTNGDQITYGPTFEAMPLSEQTGVLAHHVLHVALRHSARALEMSERLGPAFNATLYNLASDAIVNEVLLQGGHALPRPAVRASELLAAVTGPDHAGEVLAQWDTDRLYLALIGAASGGRDDASDAATAYALKQGFEPDLDRADAAQSPPEVWSARLGQAFDAGRAAGTGIGPVLHQFADLPDGRVPWEIHLRRLLARAISDVPRLSHKRPAHRWIAMEASALADDAPAPVFQPGRARDGKRPRLVIGLDTSSSITDTQLALFAGEALALTRRSGAEAHLLGFDTKVHTRTRLDNADSLRDIAFHRGGGTAFDAVLSEARRLGPSIIVMLTDLDAPTGPDPAIPVIWAVPKAPCDKPPFGIVIEMDR